MIVLEETAGEGSFNPRSREGSDILYPKNFRPLRCFNPRSREGSDRPRSLTSAESALFQSTLPRGERQAATTIEVMAEMFQSTLPRGERPDRASQSTPKTRVSIHAPARGATWSIMDMSTTPRSFNPRSREGSDGLLTRGVYYVRTFQSTLPRGERRQHGNVAGRRP